MRDPHDRRTFDLLEDLEHRIALAREARALRVYRGRLRTAPDCRDPDHPGCWRCEPGDYPEPWADEPVPHHHEDPLP